MALYAPSTPVTHLGEESANHPAQFCELLRGGALLNRIDEQLVDLLDSLAMPFAQLATFLAVVVAVG